MKYDILAKIETLDRDDAFIKDRAGLQDVLPTLKHALSTRTEPKESLYKKYFSDLPAKVLDDLYEKYKHDFNLFGYEVQNDNL